LLHRFSCDSDPIDKSSNGEVLTVQIKRWCNFEGDHKLSIRYAVHICRRSLARRNVSEPFVTPLSIIIVFRQVLSETLNRDFDTWDACENGHFKTRSKETFVSRRGARGGREGLIVGIRMPD